MAELEAPSEWDPYLAGRGERTPVLSRRSTTSSRFPGQKFEGTIQKGALTWELCDDCGHVRLQGGVHSPTVRIEGERSVVRDCVGREVHPWPR